MDGVNIKQFLCYQPARFCKIGCNCITPRRMTPVSNYKSSLTRCNYCLRLIFVHLYIIRANMVNCSELPCTMPEWKQALSHSIYFRLLLKE